MAATPARATETASSLVRKVRLELPRLLGESTALRALEDRLRAKHYLSRDNVVRLKAPLRRCQRVEDYLRSGFASPPGPTRSGRRSRASSNSQPAKGLASSARPGPSRAFPGQDQRGSKTAARRAVVT